MRGAGDGIRRDLERLGFEWDGPVVLQSRRTDRYADALARLRRAGRVYPCGCTRREAGSGPYPGTCRDGLPPGREPRSVRIRTGGAVVAFSDRVFGPEAGRLENGPGDFVVHRADGVFAYHLAMVVDDGDLAVTEIVRGADLLSSTAPQIHLQRALGLPTPAYAHLPVATDPTGRKLGKQTRAAPVADRPAGEVLWRGLAFLGQGPPRDLRDAPPARVLAWGEAHWDLAAVPRVRSRPAPP